MEYTERFISLSLLGALTLAFAPLASAEDGVAHFCDRLEGERKERCEERRANRQAIRNACEHIDDRAERRICARNEAEERGLDRSDLRRPRRHHLSSEIREELKACKQNHDNREDIKACIARVKEAHGIKGDPKRHLRRFFRNASEEVREQLKECREEDTREEKVACVKRVIEASK